MAEPDPIRDRVNALFDAIVHEETLMGSLGVDPDYRDPNHFTVRVRVGEFKTLLRDAFMELAAERSWDEGYKAAIKDVAGAAAAANRRGS